MTHARYIANDPDHLQRQFLNEMDSTLSWYWLHKPQDAYDHWARNAFGSYEVRMKAPPIWQPFLCLATKFGLTQYIQQELSARIRKDGDVNKTIFPLSDPKLVKFLLHNACRINPGVEHEYTNFNTRAPMTPWVALLRHLRDARRRGWIGFYDIDPEGTARWSKIVSMFLGIGKADVNAVVVSDQWDPEITALGVMELLDDTYGAVEVRKIKDVMAQWQAFHE
ncbi:hypothetical protein PT974_01852 [Cladobotryum mycophilum]|uniref:Uncharacterized protein n=1 Tax=Cladobotryum mycophilum TaxID=491253 RepID=A0ABR0SWN2_9HYPO